MNSWVTHCYTYRDERLYHWVIPNLMRTIPSVVPTLLRDCTTTLYLPWWGTVPLCCTYPDEGLYHWVVPTLMRDCATGLYLPWWGTVRLCCWVVLRGRRRLNLVHRQPAQTRVNSASPPPCRTPLQIKEQRSCCCGTWHFCDSSDVSIIYQIRLIAKMLSRCIRYKNQNRKATFPRW